MLKTIIKVFVAVAGITGLPIFASAATLTTTFDTTMVIELRNPLGLGENLALTGTTVWNAIFEGTNLGDAVDDDSDGLDEIEVEMVSMNLTGTSSLLGDTVQLQLLGGIPVVGEIEELVNNAPSVLDLSPYGSSLGATSRFELRFDIASSDGTFLASTSGAPGLFFAAILDDFPGLNTVYSSFGTVPLLDSFGSTGYTLGPGEFVFTNVVPVPAAAWLFGTGLLGLVGIARRKKAA